MPINRPEKPRNPVPMLRFLRKEEARMNAILTIPHRLDRSSLSCRAIIETPKGCRSKFDCDPETGLFRLHKRLPEGMSFPLDFGFIPSTKAEDGDPLDIVVLYEDPLPV